jgi:DNA-binding NarL/FixJ family response regulator
MLIFMRGMARGAFTSDVLSVLDRLRPTMGEVLATGFRREHEGRDSQSHAQGRPATEAELIAKLTRTEREILPMLQSSNTERQIASQVHRSPHTVHVHVKNIYRKLGVTSRRELHDLFQLRSSESAPMTAPMSTQVAPVVR